MICRQDIHRDTDLLQVFPNVWMDIKVGIEWVGRIEFELFNDCPLTSENFRALCTGEKGLGESRRDLYFKGTIFHRFEDGFLL